MDTPHDKLDKLDKLAHHGVIDDPSYYACIQEQFSFFSKVVDKVEELFQKYHRVIITGDHGSSRLAARFFHAREGYPAPASSQVCSHGRFCIFNGAKIIASSNQVIAKDSDGNQYLIFKITIILSSLALPPAAMMKMHNTANFMAALHLKSCLFLWLYLTASTSYHLLRHGKKILSSFL